jgi:hypothetical protein
MVWAISRPMKWVAAAGKLGGSSWARACSDTSTSVADTTATLQSLNRLKQAVTANAMPPEAQGGNI